jgi:hypothetical protein
MPSLPPGSTQERVRRPSPNAAFRGVSLSLFIAFLLGMVPAPRACSQNAPVQPNAVAAPPLTGRVQDPSGAIIPGARIEIDRSDNSVAASTRTDSAGQFRLAQPASGSYRLTVSLPGFEPLTRPIRIDRRPAPPIALTMKLATVSTSVEVHADSDVEVASPDNNQDSATISADDMKSLPVFDGDIVAALSAFTDAGVAGEGGTTLIVDGVERTSVGVAPSAIERVSVNQDPYSAFYYQPGRGQIEIITKSTADHFHGSASFTFRDAALNATNYFATVKPPEQRRIYEGFLTGPIKPLRNTAFLFSLTRQEEDTSNQVDATVLPVVTPEENVPAPTRNTYLSMKVSHQYNDHHSGYVVYRLADASLTNQTVGGLVQSSAGYTSRNFDMDITYHDDLELGANKLNQLSLLFEHNIDTISSNQESPQVIVEGVSTFGGAQLDQVNTENNPKIVDAFSWTHRNHQFKFGIQIPNLGRRVLEDRTNRQGTFTFANLAAYQAGTPESFSIQQGQERFVTLYAQPGSFFQDQIQASSRLTITPGIRYDFQNTLSNTKNAFEPRLSLAYLADKQHGLVVRVGGGIYFRRVGVNITQQLARYQDAAERSLLITSNLCYPNITACNPLNVQPPSLFLYQPNLEAPEQGYFGLSVERQLTKKSTVTLGYNGYRGWHALRSVDVNAPPPPFTSTVRPNPNYAQVLQMQSGGYQKTDGLSASYRGRISNVFAGFAQYGYQHSDSNTQFSTFMPQNQYDPNAEWSRTDYDQRQRLALFGTLYPDKITNLGIGFYNYTPLPYTVTTGMDNYHDGLSNARPAGVPRNSLNGGSYQDVQVRWGYLFKLHPKLKDSSPTIGTSISSFNTLNRVNYTNYVGVVTSPLFMRPTTASDPRRIQLNVSYTF